jgi:hypothetical protein
MNLLVSLVKEMTPRTCPRCRQIIVSDDTIAFNGDLIVHADD